MPWALDGLPRPTSGVSLFAGPGGGGYRLVWLLTRGRFARAQRRALAYLTGPVAVR